MKSLLLLLSIVPAMRLQNLITLSLGWLTACVGLAQSPPRDADRVVVVRNENSPVSRAVADDYAQRRSVQHVVCVRCQDSAANPERETIAFAAFQESLEKPLREFLSNHPSIDFIVLTKGIPLRIADATGIGLGDRQPIGGQDIQVTATRCPPIDTYVYRAGNHPRHLRSRGSSVCLLRSEDSLNHDHVSR